MLSYLSEEQNKLVEYHKSKKAVPNSNINDMIVRMVKCDSDGSPCSQRQNELLRELDYLKDRDRQGYNILKDFLTRESLKAKILTYFPTVDLEIQYRELNLTEGYFAAAIAGVTDEEMISVSRLIGKINELIKLLPPSKDVGSFIYSPEMPPVTAQREVAVHYGHNQYYGVAISFAAEEKVNEIMELMSERDVEILESFKVSNYSLDPVSIKFSEDPYFIDFDVMTLSKEGKKYHIFFQ